MQHAQAQNPRLRTGHVAPAYLSLGDSPLRDFPFFKTLTKFLPAVEFFLRWTPFLAFPIA